MALSASLPKSATALGQPVTVESMSELADDVRRVAELSGFTGANGQTFAWPGTMEEPVTVYVGLGESAAVDADGLRAAGAAFVRAVSDHQTAACAIADGWPSDGESSLSAPEAVAAVTEGIGLAAYRFDEYKSDPTRDPLRRISVIGSGSGVRKAFTEALARVQAVTLARDLTNQPGGSLTPEAFAQVARDVGDRAGLKVTVWDERRIARQRFGGLLAVNQGSTHPPRFVIVEYKPEGKATGSIGLIGKGITFDSGGLSLKTGQGMMTMKVDMAGGAAVLAAVSLLPALGSKTAATAYIPLTDNMVNGEAQRPGDVFTARNGKTVEVLNTDAEGRLVLADALAYASEQKHDALVDIATLTGAVSAALGGSYAGLMGHGDGLLDQVEQAAARRGEKIWRLPLPSEYRRQLDSPIADLKNIGGAGASGGALTAGLFLEEFVDADRPWAHLDLGMSAMVDADDGVLVRGATGSGVRLLADLVANWNAE